MTVETDFDVVIAGGGLVGSALALALGRHSTLRVALVEPYPLAAGTSASSYDDRSVAIAYGTRLILEQLGIWTGITVGSEPINGIHISERGRFGATRLSAQEEGVPALGYVVENRVLGGGLLDQMRSCESISILDESKVSVIQEKESTLDIVVDSADKSSELTTQLLIAADGADSTLRAMVGIGVSEHDYRQTAVIANVSTETAHHNIAYERFTDTGPLALLPLSENRCSMVMTVRTDQLDDIMSLDDNEFSDLLQKRFGHRLGEFTRVGKRGQFSLRLVAADAHGKGRTLLVGNARHYLHTVSGQGFNLAMRDVGVLAELLLDQNTESLDAEFLLTSYARRRQSDHNTVERFTDTLAKLFAVPFAPLAHARAAGLIVTDLIPFARHTLARQSMGLRVPLPRISSR